MTKFAKNIIRGAGSVMELIPPPRPKRHPRFYKPAPTASEALRGDWDTIGRTLRKAFEVEKARYDQAEK